MRKETKNSVWREVCRAAGLWPIWLRIGLQDIRLKYRRSVIGIGWVFLNLFIMIFAVGLIYSNLFGQNLRDFLPFLTIGLICWGYITAAIVEGGNAFVASEGYIKQIGLPLYVYIFRFFVSITLTMLISLPAFLIIGILYAVPFKLGVIWALLGFLLLQGVSFFLIAIFSHLNVRFRDAAHIASVGLQVMFFITPIIWPPEMLARHRLRWVMDFNPFYHLLEVVRKPLLLSIPASDTNYIVVALFMVGLALVAWIFTKFYSHRIAYLL
jgi:ABC-type polysaccharide/polyol phosphate export permease